MSRKWSAWVLLALMAACTRSNPQARPTSGHAPEHVGHRTFCTLTHPITAAGGLYYPPRYPSQALPDADRCFVSISEARGAGLHPAPPPPGSRFVGGIYLMPTGPRMLRLCHRSARRFRLAAACPGLVPSPIDALEGPYPPDFLLEEMFEGPSSYVGMGHVGVGGPSIGHLWIASTGERLSAQSICFGYELHGPPIRARPTRVRELRAWNVSCPQGSSTHSGHVVLFWKEAGAWHLVSLHGHSDVNRRMDLAIANSSQLVRP